MEPLSATINSIVPKLHLLDSDSRTRSSANHYGSISECLRSSRRHPETLPSARSGKGKSARLTGTSVEFLESAVLPPMHLRSAANGTTASSTSFLSSRRTKQATATESTVRSKTSRERDADLHPTMHKLAREHDEDLASLLLERWSMESGEEHFASISLFCEMKLNEAKRLASWADTPNRFYTVVCCQLLEKYISRVALTNTASNIVDPVATAVGQSIAFLQKIFDELLTSIFLPSTQPQGHNQSRYEHRTPYFTEVKRLRHKTQALLTTVNERESTWTTKQEVFNKVSKLIARVNDRRNCQMLALTFRGWANAMAAQHQIRALKLQAFQCKRRTNLTGWLRVWRIEALRQASRRESADHQAMVAVTAASLSKKDLALAEAEEKVKAMTRIIDSLTESNQHLSNRVDYLETLSTATVFTNDDDSHVFSAIDTESRRAGATDNSRLERKREVESERLEFRLTQDDKRMDSIHRMLLETLFGMARMVETCAIQLSKDTMDSLEYQLDGSVLEHLAATIQTENECKAKLDAADGSASLYFSKNASGFESSTTPTTSSLAAAKPSRPRAVTVRDLAQMPIDTLLLYWFRMHLSSSSAVGKPSDRTIKNFTSDLVDGRRYSFLLHRLFPMWFDSSMVHEVDSDQRLQNIATFHERVQPPLPQVVTSDSIHAASGTENLAFVAMLFGTAVGKVRKVSMEKQRGEFLNVTTLWRRVRGLLLEVKRMDVHHDASIVAYLLKKMRTCETLCKRLHAELNHIAVTSNEVSSALAQIAYKTLAITWSCVHARAVHPTAPLKLVDERTHERGRDLSCVDTSCIRAILVHESNARFAQLDPSYGCDSSSTTHLAEPAMPPVVPERDVGIAFAAVSRALLAYSKDLDDIFRHYSASGGAGSLAAMSLAEFNKFVNDCFRGDSMITLQVAETVFKAALPLPLTGEASALSFETVRAVQATSKDGLEEQELSGRQFADALVRLAAVKYAPILAPRASPREEQTRTALPLDERLCLLMEHDILPHALRSQRELFRAEVAHPKVREVFQRHKSILQRIFRYYASMHVLREQHSTLSLSGFIVMARDCKLIGSFVTEHTLKQVLVNLQREEDRSALSTLATEAMRTEAEIDTLRADFTDFLEALAALTEYVICNPYVAFHKRVDHFLIKLVLPRARQMDQSGD